MSTAGAQGPDDCRFFFIAPFESLSMVPVDQRLYSKLSTFETKKNPSMSGTCSAPLIWHPSLRWLWLGFTLVVVR